VFKFSSLNPSMPLSVLTGKLEKAYNNNANIRSIWRQKVSLMRGIVGHIWLPEFYSSVEMKINEAISNDAIFVIVKGHKVLDISPGARGKGVRFGMTLRQARIVCPELVRIEYTPQRYGDFAEQVWEVCATFSPAVEPLDETEAFIELSFCPNIIGTLYISTLYLKFLLFLKRNMACLSKLGSIISKYILHYREPSQMISDLWRVAGFKGGSLP
jgi:hypothetical protein